METITNTDLRHLKRCVELAEEALAMGNEPFGSLLVSSYGKVLFEARNEVVTKNDHTRHPEFEITRWATSHLTPHERKQATVYTSGEHCSMCAAAHGWVGLGRIVYASSTDQLITWLKEFKVSPSPIYPLRIQEVVKNVEVSGPVSSLSEKVKALHQNFHSRP